MMQKMMRIINIITKSLWYYTLRMTTLLVNWNVFIILAIIVVSVVVVVVVVVVAINILLFHSLRCTEETNTPSKRRL